MEGGGGMVEVATSADVDQVGVGFWTLINEAETRSSELLKLSVVCFLGYEKLQFCYRVLA